MRAPWALDVSTGTCRRMSVVTGTEKEPPDVAAKASEGAATRHGEAIASRNARAQQSRCHTRMLRCRDARCRDARARAVRAVGRRGDQAARLAEAGAACAVAGG
jgi:hypothetical protein